MGIWPQFFVSLLAAASAVASQATPASVYQQAAAELQKGNAKAAEDLVDPLLRKNPKDLRALTLKGMAATAQGRRDEANAQYLAALEVQPRFQWLQIAWCLG